MKSTNAATETLPSMAGYWPRTWEESAYVLYYVAMRSPASIFEAVAKQLSQHSRTEEGLPRRGQCRRRARGHSRSGHRPPAAPDPHERFADLLADWILRGDYGSIRALADDCAGRMRELKLVRKGSSPGTVHRRLQEFLSAYVYGKRIPEEALSRRINMGRISGGIRHGETG